MEYTFFTAIGCKGYHSHEIITSFGYYKYRVKEFYEITCCYIKEKMNICSLCKKCVDCKKVLNITFFCDGIYERNRKRESCISHVTVRWHCFKHKFRGICSDTAGTTFVPFPLARNMQMKSGFFLKKKNFV